MSNDTSLSDTSNAAAYESITVQPVSPHIGAEIGNIDLTRPLPNNQVEELHRAFIQYQVIFFRDQKISFDDQIRFGRYFGPLGKHVGGATISKTTENPLCAKIPLRRNVDADFRRELSQRPILRSDSAARQHSLQSHRSARWRRRHHVREHVCRL